MDALSQAAYIGGRGGLSVKKHKKNECENNAQYEEEMLDQTEEMGGENQKTPRASFAAVVQGRKMGMPIYTGEGEDDSMNDLSMADII